MLVRFVFLALVFGSAAAASAQKADVSLRFDTFAPAGSRLHAARPHRLADERARMPAEQRQTRLVIIADPADSLALVELYLATSGITWADRAGWLVDPVATWAGVSLGASGRVTELVLSGNNLAGALPTSITTLDSLQVLDLSDNLLAGSLPADYTRWQVLRDLRFWGNDLGGSLPAGLGTLPALEELWLFDNTFTGSIPESLGNISTLRRLYLDQNALSGPIPASLGNLAALTELFLDTNRLSGPIPESLGQLHGLNVLFLGDNELDGPFPASFEQLTELRILSMPNLALGGTFPGAVYQMQRLTALVLTNNEFEGTLTTDLYGLTLLTRLYLDGNRLSGEIPPDLGFAAIDLRELVLRDNTFTGPIPPSLGFLGLLERLDLGRNDFTGDIPADLGLAARLRYLWLDANQLTGPLPVSFANLQLLTELDLADNQLSGPLPDWLGQFVLLEWLNLGLNQFDGFLPEGLGDAAALQLLSLPVNRLSGPIPASFDGLRSLRLLDLGLNDLEGPLPEALAAPPALIQVLLDGNTFTGPIPEAFARQASLEVLQLTNNRLTGTLPAGFNDLTSLRRLDVANNQLDTLPVLTGMSGIDLLDVRLNRLSFEDLAPNLPFVSGAVFAYAPQNAVLPVVDRVDAGTRLTARVAGEGNRYQWFRAAQAIPGETAPTLLLADGQNDDIVQGAVTNPAVAGLTIVTAPVRADVALARIVLEPASAMLAPGDTLDYTPLGFDAQETEIAFTPRWTATGGSIDSTGRFIAGVAFGTYEVRVENLAGNVFATASLTLSDPNTTSTEASPTYPAVGPDIYPQPFTDEALFRIDIAAGGDVEVVVYDLLGREQARYRSAHAAGSHLVRMDGRTWPAGMYVYRLQAGEALYTGTLVKVR